MDPAKGVRVLDEAEDNRVPSEEEVREYANFLEIDIDDESHLMWIAREGVVAPVPHPWKMCTENDEDFFYFNFETGESVWDHPSDEKYREMVKEYREKAAKGGTPGDSLESGMTSKLESKLDQSIGSPASQLPPLETPVKGDTSSKDDMVSKLDISKDGSVVKDEVCKFEQDSALNSSLASPVPAELNSSQRDPVVIEKATEVSEDSRSSSDDEDRISGPPSPRSAGSNASASRSGFADDPADKSKDSARDSAQEAASPAASPTAGRASSKDERSPGEAAAGISPSSLQGTPQGGLLEASGADVVVDLAADASEDSTSLVPSPLPSPGGLVSGKKPTLAPLVTGKKPTLAPVSAGAAADAGAGGGVGGSSSPKQGGDDAAGRASSQAAVKGWQSLVGGAVQSAAEKEAKEQESSKGRRVEEPSQEDKSAAVPEEKQRGAGSGGAAAGGSAGSDAPSEVSEEYPSEFANSPAASHSGVLGGRSPTTAAAKEAEDASNASLGALDEAPYLGRADGGCEAPEPEVATAAVPAPAASASTELGTKQTLSTWAQVEAELASLTRCLSMLRDIREKQAKFLQLLQG
uniref:WW domain-containing protein n=1 Tax=Alexandrium monilatum TaxID=311494 RepID=A0A7S4SA11_9DINO